MTTQPPRKSYPSDLSDARWELMEPTLSAWRAEWQKTSLHLGGKLADLREVMNAILYVNRTGIPWRYLPHDFPAHTTVFSHFSAWTTDGTIEKLGIRLHRLVREQEGRKAEPTACAIDAQSVKPPPACPRAPRESTPGRRSSAASAASSSTPSACCCWSWSPRPASPTTRPASSS
nr:transposase [Streptomyces sp. YIM 121038]